MESEIIEINENFWFGCKHHHSIKSLNDAIQCFSYNIGNAQKLDGNALIFLDTNVLTDYYKISSVERRKLKDQIKLYQSRIILTKTVEEEFLKNRTNIIRNRNRALEENLVKRFKKVKSSIEKLEKGKVDGLEQYFNNNIVKSDFSNIAQQLKDIEETLRMEITKIISDNDIMNKMHRAEGLMREYYNDATRDNIRHEKEDQFLEVLSNLKVLGKLPKNEVIFIQNRYEELIKEYKVNNSDEKNRWKYAFPGCEENNGKETPENDLIIFHEIMKYMKENNKDAIFLTNDTAKGDWINKKGEQFIHYTENVYANTKQMIYILNARKILDISYEEIYKNNLTRKIRYPNPNSIANNRRIMNFMNNDLNRLEIDALYLIFQFTNYLSNKSFNARMIIEDDEILCFFNEEALNHEMNNLCTKGYLTKDFEDISESNRMIYFLSEKAISWAEKVKDDIFIRNYKKY